MSRQQRRKSGSSGYYTQSTGYSRGSGYYTQNTGYGQSTVGQSSDDYSYRTDPSYRSGYTDPSYRSGYDDEYDETYGDEASQYSSGSYEQQQSRQYEDMGTQSRGYTTEFEDSTIRSSQHEPSSHVSAVRRDDDAMSQRSYQSTVSRTTAAFRSGDFSVSGRSNATTIADGGRGRCPYQIEFSVNNTGKQMSASKRIISFRFGFADSKSIMQGKSGVECRGEEHDVLITWSITGGKRSIHVDGREIHFQAGKRGPISTNPSRRADIFEAAWQMPDDHVCKLLCYAYKPSMGSPEKKDKKWRQYNLIIDGRSFFDLPQIFDLGLKGLGMLKAAPHELPPMLIEANDADMLGFMPPPNKPKIDDVVKRDVQSRIQAQRQLLKSRQKSLASNSNRSRQSLAREHSSNSSVSTMGSHHSGYSTESNLIDMTDGLNLSDNDRTVNISSNAPSELDEARRRQAELQKIPESRPFQQNQTHHLQYPALHHLQYPALPSSQTHLQMTPSTNTERRCPQVQPRALPACQGNAPEQLAHPALLEPPGNPTQQSPLTTHQNNDHYHQNNQQQMSAINNQQRISSHQNVQQTNNASGPVVYLTNNRAISPRSVNTMVPQTQQNGIVQQPPMAMNIMNNAVTQQSNALAPRMVPQQTSQQIVTSNQYHPQQMDTAPSNLVCTQPPSMRDIHNSMSNVVDRVSTTSSGAGTNKFGYY